MAPLLAPIFTWLFREVLVKFVIFAGLFVVLALFVPMAVGYLAPYIGTTGLTSAFGSIGPGVWFFLDFFQVSYGLPLIISAYVTRFLIRRLPVIG